MWIGALTAAAVMSIAPVLALAQTQNTNWPHYQEDNFIIADYKFVSGETLPQLKLHYRTLGSAERNAAGEIINGVLLLQGNTGTGANWLRPTLADELFKAGQPLDAGPILHHHPRRPRSRRFEQTLRWAQGRVPSLPVSRHGRQHAPARHRGAQSRPSAPRDRQVARVHAQLYVGRDVSRHDGRHRRAVLPASRDQWPQPDLAPCRSRSDPP